MYVADTVNNRIRKVTMSTETSSPRYLPLLIKLHYSLILSFTRSLTLNLTHSLNIYSRSASPTLVPSTMLPTTSTPSSNYPSLSPSIGIINTFAGTGSTTYSGDNGQATAAGLNTPFGVEVDAAGMHLKCY